MVRSSKRCGSSPLARGTPGAEPPRGLVRRFIPARAGNTKHGRIYIPQSSVHPRSRGEHGGGGGRPSGGLGSSPLARGTHIALAPERAVRRFIPARAGNTQRASRRASKASVHPRSRGEHRPLPSVRPSPAGSSPLARGTRGVGPGEPPGLRFIPARAGNTARLPSTARERPVHPRSRGEHRTSPRDASPTFGSSPLARGTPPDLRHGPARGRFIPARAGNTPWQYGHSA